jgi:hypothetical protein
MFTAPRFIPYPFDLASDGRPWYVLDLKTGDILSYKNRGRLPKGATEPTYLKVPIVLNGTGKLRQITLRGPDGLTSPRTRNKIIRMTLEHFWGIS